MSCPLAGHSAKIRAVTFFLYISSVMPRYYAFSKFAISKIVVTIFFIIFIPVVLRHVLENGVWLVATDFFLEFVRGETFLFKTCKLCT